jgi:hypothetical protein
MSYLSGASYLEDEFPEGDAGNATSQLYPALGDEPSVEVITLPGGISMPKKTFYAVLALLALLLIIVLIRRRRAAAPEAAA